jgi:intracellular septation protein
MKLLLDFLPILLFFGTFKFAESHKDWAADFATRHFGSIVSAAASPRRRRRCCWPPWSSSSATLAQVLWLKARRQKVDTMLWVSLGLVVVLGGATIYFQSETFIKWKPSALYWAMGLALWLSPLLTGKNLLKVLLGEQMQLPPKVWHRLNFAWIAFFGLMGILNLWVAYTFSTSTWVNFKLFGGIGLMLLFTLAQGLFLASTSKSRRG